MTTIHHHPHGAPHDPAVASRAAAGAAAAAGVSWQDMVAHRDYLVRYAQRKLLDPTLAEDVVHDVFEAVLTGRASFAGRSALRSWLTAVLKHKIVDLVRQRAHYDSFDSGAGEDDGSGLDAIECPHARPDEIAEQRQALRLTLRQIDALPSGLRDVVRLRVLQDQPTEQVCRSLSITEENLFVRLHRARRQLAS